MKRLVAMAALIAGFLPAASGQRIFVVSEFQRIRPDGEVVSMDRVARPREILSPAMARNAYTTLRIVVEAPPGTPYTIYIGQNPDDSCDAWLYQEQYAQINKEWVAEKVQKVTLPHSAQLGADQKVQTYLLDLFVPDKTPAGRFRLELQMYVNSRWIIYPMEMRVQRVAAKGKGVPSPGAAPASERSDRTPERVFREWVCGKEATGAFETGHVNAFLLRNARQDLAIARDRGQTEPLDGVQSMMLKASGITSKAEYCASTEPAPKGAEWWLRVRDFLYQGMPVQ